MGRIDAVFSDITVEDFRIAIVKRLGGRKGDFSKALEEVIQLWLKKDQILVLYINFMLVGKILAVHLHHI